MAKRATPGYPSSESVARTTLISQPSISTDSRAAKRMPSATGTPMGDGAIARSVLDGMRERMTVVKALAYTS